jgi:hypothetical protein
MASNGAHSLYTLGSRTISVPHLTANELQQSSWLLTNELTLLHCTHQLNSTWSVKSYSLRADHAENSSNSTSIVVRGPLPSSSCCLICFQSLPSNGSVYHSINSVPVLVFVMAWQVEGQFWIVWRQPMQQVATSITERGYATCRKSHCHRIY